MSAWKHGSTGRSTSWPAQGCGLWHGSLPYENRPPRQEVGDGPRLRRPQGLFLRVRVCIAMLWCLRRDSNPHARRQRLLRSRCLPIPPRRRDAPQNMNKRGDSTPTGIRTQDLVLIRHDTRYKLAALTAELWGRGHDIDGIEEADAAGAGGANSAEVGYPRWWPRRSFSPLCSVRHALAQALWSSGPARSEELPSLPLAWSHESHSCTRIP